MGELTPYHQGANNLVLKYWLEYLYFGSPVQTLL